MLSKIKLKLSSFRLSPPFGTLKRNDDLSREWGDKKKKYMQKKHNNKGKKHASQNSNMDNIHKRENPKYPSKPYIQKYPKKFIKWKNDNGTKGYINIAIIEKQVGKK